METVYAVRSIYTGPRNYISMGLLPMKENIEGSTKRLYRPGNINTPYNHVIWKLKNGIEYKEWFIKAFPRLPLDEWINDDEWDRFAQNKGTTFPPCQYSPGSAIWSPIENNNKQSGIVLVGDACK